MSIGNSNIVGYRSSGAIGTALKTAGMDQFVIGCANTAESSHAFEIGNGDPSITWDSSTGKTEYGRQEELESLSNAFAVTWNGNVEMALDVNAATSTTDGALYAAIESLGWESEVII